MIVPSVLGCERAVDVVLQVFRSVEERNPRLAAVVYHDELEFHWPRPLPYTGSSYSLAASLQRRPGWAETWDPFQARRYLFLSWLPLPVASSQAVDVPIGCPECQPGPTPIGLRATKDLGSSPG